MPTGSDNQSVKTAGLSIRRLYKGDYRVYVSHVGDVCVCSDKAMPTKTRRAIVPLFGKGAQVHFRIGDAPIADKTWKFVCSQRDAASVSESTLNALNEDMPGHWITANGRHIFVPDDAHTAPVHLPAKNFGIKRKEMPQIAKAQHAKFVEWLDAKGIKTHKDKMRASALKPTQAEFDPEKIHSIRQKRSLGDYPLIVSRDGYILDGHHRWAGVLNRDGSKQMSVLRVDLPIKKLLATSKEFPGTTYKDVHETLRVAGLAMARQLNEALADMDEGLSDPHILKAVFVLGGGGSGKSFLSGKMFGDTGLRVVNPDDATEFLAKKHGVNMKTDMLSDKMQNEIRPKAKHMIASRQDYYLRNRTGVLIDGTGGNVAKILKQRKQLEDLGYDTSAVLVNTPLEVALKNNAKRDRVVPTHIVKDDWEQVQKAISTYKEAFGDSFHEIKKDRVWSDEEMKKEILPELNKVARRMVDSPLKNPRGHAWLKQETKGMKDTSMITHVGKSSDQKSKIRDTDKKRKKPASGEDDGFRTLKSGRVIHIDDLKKQSFSKFKNSKVGKRVLAQSESAAFDSDFAYVAGRRLLPEAIIDFVGRRQINEIKAARFVQHFGRGQLGVMSAERAEMSRSEKKAASHRLEKRLKELGYGFVHVKGQYVYDNGDVSTEPSYMVPNMSKEHALQLGKEFGQESVIHSKGGTPTGYYTDKERHGQKTEWGDKWRGLTLKPAETGAKTRMKNFEFAFTDHEIKRVKKDPDDEKWVTLKGGQHVMVRESIHEAVQFLEMVGSASVGGFRAAPLDVEPADEEPVKPRKKPAARRFDESVSAAPPLVSGFNGHDAQIVLPFAIGGMQIKVDGIEGTVVHAGQIGSTLRVQFSDPSGRLRESVFFYRKRGA